MALLLGAMGGSPLAIAQNKSVDYVQDVKPILQRKCYACHSALKQEANLRLDTVDLMKAGGESGPVVVANDLFSSILWNRVHSADEFSRMPPKGEPLSDLELEKVKQWILLGAHSPLREQPQNSPADHWSFQPLQNVIPPASDAQPIDAFIEEKLHAHKLKLSPPVDSTALLRRLFLTLHGLPPSPQELEHWQARIKTPSGRLQLINSLLDSPRYAERIAQFWLDIVRYADTHGFEVNTSRPNAWPYRDYVIQSFKNDKPYDQFIREQLAGDQLQTPEGTGFLVAAAVLLPGQIGKDDASKRLARQDALDEIIVGASATFLGLTIGCARCHDHKFDPISQNDYYALQAFFAGVTYGQRPIKDKVYQSRLDEAEKLSIKIRELEKQISASRPYENPGSIWIIDDEDLRHVSVLKKKNGHGVNPDGIKRGYKNDPGDIDRMPNLSNGRYTWWDNTPGEDVFTWNPSLQGRFRIWISWGVHGSGIHTRDARYILDHDGNLSTRHDQTEIIQADQFYFARQAEGESEKKPRWSGLLNAGVHDLGPESKVVLRGGKTGAGITADVLVLQELLVDSANTHDWPCLRVPVAFDQNEEYFSSIEAKYVRFTSLHTTHDDRHEPCLDELEVYTSDDIPVNIALASRGTTPSSSGNYSTTGYHQLAHVNDGLFGNEKSWISNVKGQGWVQLEFPKVFSINRIVWGRDRTKKYMDRLPVSYRIDVSVDGERWVTVTDSRNRLPLGTPFDTTTTIIRNAPPEEQKVLRDTMRALKEFRQRDEELRKPRLIYAGVFHEPDSTRLLLRGDPEQPQELVNPSVPRIFGDMSLPFDSQEHERRLALADWIASPDNPLTARVMVNRIWQMHFGCGLIATPSDFGLNGARPSHPELLDWLTNQFIASGWSVKALHRLILMSRTFQQASYMSSLAETVDADNTLLWRFPSRRLEAEAIRDSMLAVSGELNFQMGGPGFDFFKTRGGLSGFPPVQEFGPDRLRRMIYAHRIRMESIPVFGAFDCPDAGQPAPKRQQSTTPIQALNLFNSEFVLTRAQAIAKRVEQTFQDDEEKIIEVFRLMLGRQPTQTEMIAAQQAVSESDLAMLARVLLNSNEFVYIP
ncbi:MAG: DUF1553 domain-containing protein [Pirellulales bacterium]